MKLSSSSLLFAAGIAGVVAGVASVLPIIGLVNCLLCGWLWIGGIVAVRLYNSREPQGLDAKNGLIVGAVTGLIALVVTTILGFLLGDFVSTVSITDLPPEAAQALDEIGIGMEALIAMGAVAGIVCSAVFFTGFGALGGLIGASIFKKK
jgi:hypothetical protein